LFSTGRAYSAPPDTLAVFRGFTSKERGWEGTAWEKKGRRWERKGREGGEDGRE